MALCYPWPIYLRVMTMDTNEDKEKSTPSKRIDELRAKKSPLDIEGVDGPANVGIFGTASEVEQQFRDFADAGATDLLAAIFPGSDDAEPSMQETRDLLKSLISSV